MLLHSDPTAGMRVEIVSDTKEDASIARYRKKRERRHKPKNCSLLVGSKAPNMSRRVQGPTLCAFPTFDKCDSLVFLPTTLVTCFNTENFDALDRAFKLHMHKSCSVHFKGMQYNVNEFVPAMALLSQLHPDKVSCCRETKVVDNSICATVLCKFTDSSPVSNAITKTGRDLYPKFFSCADRASRWKHQLGWSQLSSEEQERAVEAAASGADLLVYGSLQYKFTFDPHTRKVTRLEYDITYTSVGPVESCDVSVL